MSIFSENLHVKFVIRHYVYLATKYFYRRLAKLKHYGMILTTRILSFLTKRSQLFLTKRLPHFERGFCCCNNCLMLKYYLKDFHLSVFKNYDTPIRVAILKIAVKMADPNSLIKNHPYP